jgi:hypothetical protein
MSVLVRPDRLLATARDSTGLDDFGDDELFGGDAWRDGFALLHRVLPAETRLHELGALAAEFEQTGYLTQRLRLVDHHRRHPEIRDRDILPPVVIIGQARTGTTLLHDLLAQDRDHRAPLSWEVESPIPPPRTESYWTDPRIDEVDALIAGIDGVVPEFRGIHQLGGRLAQECGRIFCSSFISSVFGYEFHVPTYLHWWLHGAALDGHIAAAYTWHRRFLEVLQSKHQCRRWLLKWPSHTWTLPLLLAQYPGAVLVQTHRDPARAAASNASLVRSLRKLYTNEIDLATIGPEFSELIIDGFERTVDARLDGTVPADRVIDLQFDELTTDPLGACRAIYDRFGWELRPETVQRMAAFLRDNPRRASGHQYRFDGVGLELADVRSRTARYSKYFRVPEEDL